MNRRTNGCVEFYGQSRAKLEALVKAPWPCSAPADGRAGVRFAVPLRHHRTRRAQTATQGTERGDCGRERGWGWRWHRPLLSLHVWASLLSAGLFEQPLVNDTAHAAAVLNSEAHQALALRSAEEGIVLLKNKGAFLPLSKPPASIAVVGPNGGCPAGAPAKQCGARSNLLGSYTQSVTDTLCDARRPL